MLSLSVPVLIWELTESVTLIGTAALASNLPSFFGSPLGGVWADRHSKRVVLMLALVAQTIFTLLLYQLSVSPLLSVPLLLALAAAIGFASSVNLSAYQALVAEIVPVRHLRPAYRLNAIQFNLSRAVGPAVAGLVLANWGPPMAFLLNAFAHIPLFLVLLTVRPKRAEPGAQTNVVHEITEAARIAWNHPALRIALITVSVTSAFGMSVQQLAKGLTEQVFHVDDGWLGILVASIGVSAVLTAIVAAAIGDRIRGSLLTRWGLLLYGVGLWTVGATDQIHPGLRGLLPTIEPIHVGLVGFAITGFAHVLVNVSVTTALQAHVPNAFRGRVTSLQMMGIILSMAFGAQLGGALGDLQGLPFVLALYGGLLIGFAAFSQRRMEGLRALD